MPFPIASGSGQPAYNAFIPEIWSGKLIEKFYDATVLAQIANTDYEGEIKAQGDKVIIRQVPTMIIRDYERGMNLQVDRPDAPAIELEIDKGKYFNAQCEDVAKVQSDIDLMNTWSTDASEQMKIAIDGSVINAIAPDAVAANRGTAAGRISQNINLGATGDPVLLSSNNVIDWIVDLGQVLDEQNIPETGRWLVLPAWVCSLIKKSDIRNASISGGDQSLYRNGRIGEIDNFTIYKSNVLTGVVDNTGTAGGRRCFRPLAGHKNALTFASQMTKMETLRSENTFADLMRGLQIYGFKVVDGTAMASAYVARA